jgi:hypothetical protein
MIDPSSPHIPRLSPSRTPRPPLPSLTPSFSPSLGTLPSRATPPSSHHASRSTDRTQRPATSLAPRDALRRQRAPRPLPSGQQEAVRTRSHNPSKNRPFLASSRTPEPRPSTQTRTSRQTRTSVRTRTSSNNHHQTTTASSGVPLALPLALLSVRPSHTHTSRSSPAAAPKSFVNAIH